MFSVSEYFDRMEKASLEILETMEPIDKTITLWWGFDGIRLSEDGTSKWVSRKKKPVENVFYQPCQSIRRTFPYGVPFESGTLRYSLTDQSQSTRAQIEELQMRATALQAQSFYTIRQQQMESMVQRCCCDNFWR